MADLNPPPLFPPANTGGDATDIGGVTTTHDEIPCRVVGPKVVPSHLHLYADPDTDTTNAQGPSLLDHEPKWVQPQISRSNPN